MRSLAEPGCRLLRRHLQQNCYNGPDSKGNGGGDSVASHSSACSIKGGRPGPPLTGSMLRHTRLDNSSPLPASSRLCEQLCYSSPVAWLGSQLWVRTRLGLTRRAWCCALSCVVGAFCTLLRGSLCLLNLGEAGRYALCVGFCGGWWGAVVRGRRSTHQQCHLCQLLVYGAHVAKPGRAQRGS